MRGWDYGQLVREFGREVADLIWCIPPDQQGEAIRFARDETERCRGGLRGLGSEIFQQPFQLKAELLKKNLSEKLLSYFPSWCWIVWPPTSWGLPKWVWGAQKIAEDRVWADVSARRLDAQLFTLPEDLAKATTAQSGGSFDSRFAGPTPFSTSLKFGDTSIIPPDWGRMDMEVLKRIAPSSPPADLLGAYLRLVTVPYLPKPTRIGISGTRLGSAKEFFTIMRALVDMRSMIARYNAEANLLDRAWSYDKTAQDAALAVIDQSFDRIRDYIATGPGVEKAPIGIVNDAYGRAINAGYDLETVLRPKPPSGALSTWQEIGLGVAKAAATMVSAIAGGPVGAVAVMGTLAASEIAQQNAEAAAKKELQKQVDAQIAAQQSLAEGEAALAEFERQQREMAEIQRQLAAQEAAQKMQPGASGSVRSIAAPVAVGAGILLLSFLWE